MRRFILAIVIFGAISLSLPTRAHAFDYRDYLDHPHPVIQAWAIQQHIEVQHYLRAVAVQNFLEYLDREIRRWWPVAMCETAWAPGNPNMGKAPHWFRVEPRYSGGLGFANGTWTHYRDDFMALNAGNAPIAHQVIVARRVANDHPAHTRPWDGCTRFVPYN